jgi:hypothetical protein
MLWSFSLFSSSILVGLGLTVKSLYYLLFSSLLQNTKKVEGRIIVAHSFRGPSIMARRVVKQRSSHHSSQEVKERGIQEETKVDIAPKDTPPHLLPSSRPRLLPFITSQ